MRELFSRRPQPYYIYMPEYRRNSAGIRVMHMLCDALNRSGQEAYITSEHSPVELVTPYLSDDIKRRHVALGLEPVGIYPEIIDGNPLNTNVVVRYLLNQPGFIKTTADYGDNDIFYAYTRDLVQPGMPADRVMFLPAFDLSVFRPSDDTGKRVAGRVCYYQGRSKQATIDPALLPADAVEITPRWPDSWEALSDLFQQCEYFYCGESSGLAAEAVLCGCLAVVLPSDWVPNKIAQHESKSHGVAWSLEPDELERARSTLGMLRERLLMQQREFWEALDRFIDTTQAAAGLLLEAAPVRALPAWLESRQSTAQQRLALVDAGRRPATATLEVLVLDNAPPGSPALARTLSSLQGCPLDTLQVTVLAASPVAPEVKHVHWEGEHTASVVNALVLQATAQWQLIVKAGVAFSHDALLLIGRELAAQPTQCVALYADELSRAGDGSLAQVLRPDLNLDLLLGNPGMLGGHWLLRRDALLQLGGFDDVYGRAFELDYQLRLIEHFGLGCVAHVSTPLLVKDVAERRTCPYEQAAIARHLKSRGYDQGQVVALPSGHYRVAYGQNPHGSVSILIPLRGTLVQFQRCITSLLERTRHPALEVLLIAPTDLDEEVHAWLAAVEQIAGGLLRVLSFNAGLPWTYLCNQAAQQASGEYVVWLEASTVELGQDWLGQLMDHAQRPEVGAVGGKLLTPACEIFSAGMVLGLDGVAGAAFEGGAHQAGGYMQRLEVAHGVAALSHHCLALRRELFLQAGGFDEDPLIEPWVAVDLCLKLQQAGYLNICTPWVQLIVDPEQVDAPGDDQAHAMYQRWLPMLANDPAYNRHFPLTGKGGFAARKRPLIRNFSVQGTSLPKVVVHPGGFRAASLLRAIHPFDSLRANGAVDGMIALEPLSVVELERVNPDVIVLQQHLGEVRLAEMARMRTFSTAFKVFDLGEYLAAPLRSSRLMLAKDMPDHLRRGLALVDRFIVATPAMAQLYEGLHADLRVLPTRLPAHLWRGLCSRRRVSERPRVGWIADACGDVDLAPLLEVIRQMSDEVDWVFYGHCPEELRGCIRQFQPVVVDAAFPAILAGLDLDLGLLPRQASLQNDCRDDVRVLQLGACGVPVICSDVRSYQDYHLYPFKRVANTSRAWLDAIRLHLSDLDACAMLGDALREAVMANGLLEGQALLQWHAAWQPD